MDFDEFCLLYVALAVGDFTSVYSCVVLQMFSGKSKNMNELHLTSPKFYRIIQFSDRLQYLACLCIDLEAQM